MSHRLCEHPAHAQFIISKLPRSTLINSMRMLLVRRKTYILSCVSTSRSPGRLLVGKDVSLPCSYLFSRVYLGLLFVFRSVQVTPSYPTISLSPSLHLSGRLPTSFSHAYLFLESLRKFRIILTMNWRYLALTFCSE